jgi:2-polyprenyl-3-methyl-5-hydroxy-6-metoxy-1,4-benzoquinol methylase
VLERSLTGRVEALAREAEQRFEAVERSAGRRSEVLEQAVERVRAVETRAEASAIRALVHQVLAEREDQWRALRAQVARTEGKVRRLLHQQAAAGSADPTPAVEDAPAPASPELDSLGFGEWFWGPPAEVRRRRQPYVDLFVGSGPVLDVGCGRGEFLALLREAGVEARGIDEDLDMVLLCREQGLSVEQREALSDLRAQPEGSLGGVFAAHVVEHVEPAQAIEFVHLVRRALRPGGVLVLETPNPACLMTFASSFYMDFTHRRPFHPEALRFLALSMGFGDVEIRPLALVDPSLRMPILESPVLGDRTEQFNRSVTCLNDLLFGAQDYALVARRP